jgi:uncharacterized membrane protein YkoI
MLINPFKENFIYKMAEPTSTSTVPKTEKATNSMSDEEKIKLKKQILDNGGIYFSDPNDPKKKQYAGHGELGITTVLSSKKILRNPLSRASNNLDEFDIEKTDQNVTIYRKKQENGNLHINFTAVKKALQEDKTKPFTTKIIDEEYPHQSIEYTSNPDGSKSVKIEGDNMKINFEDPKVNGKIKRIKNTLAPGEYVEPPNAYVTSPPESKQSNRIMKIYGDMKINGTKVKDIPPEQFKIRDKSSGISASVKEVSEKLRSASLSNSTSTNPDTTSAKSDSRSRSTTQ